MNEFLLLLIVIYTFYITMILLIGLTTMDYYGQTKLFVMDLTIPFYRIIREAYRDIFKKYDK